MDVGKGKEPESKSLEHVRRGACIAMLLACDKSEHMQSTIKWSLMIWA
jgi:hypothetical protein